MNLSRLGIKRPITILMLVSAIILMGMISFIRLPIDLFPNIDLPAVVILTEYEGAGPQEVENMVTQNIEKAVSTVDGLESIISTSRTGQSEIILRFGWGVDMDFAALETRERVDIVYEMLPDGIGNPIVMQLDPGMLPVAGYSMEGDVDVLELTEIAEGSVQNQIERIEGVASVSVSGGHKREIEILLDPYKLNSYGLSYEDTIKIIRGSNLDISGGTVNDGYRNYGVRAVGEFESIEEIENLIIGASDTGPIRLSEVGEVRDLNKEMLPITKLNGEQIISLGIRKESDANTVEVVNQVNDELRKLEEELPHNIVFETAFDQSEFIENSVESIIEMAILGAIFAMIVLYLFLGNIKSTLIIGIAIPIAIIGTFILIYFRGDTLNFITLGGLALGIGMMVDSAIVILENIFRKRELGYDAVDGAIDGSEEVTSAIIAATITSIVAFLPVVYVEGIAGILFAPLAWTVTFALITALLVAIVVIPVLTVKFMPNKLDITKKKRKIPLFVDTCLKKLSDIYESTLKEVMDHPIFMIAFVIGLLIITVMVYPLVGFDFIPSMDTGEVSIEVVLPTGSDLEENKKIVEGIEEDLLKIPEVEKVFSQIGGSSVLRGDVEEESQLIVLLVPERERDRDVFEVSNDIRKVIPDIPGTHISVNEEDVAGVSLGSDISISVRGNDLRVIEDITDDIQEQISSVEGVVDVETSFDIPSHEIQIELDRQRAQTYGVLPYHIGQFISLTTDTHLISFFREDGEEYDIRLGLSQGDDMTIDELESLLMETPTGDTVPLDSIADLKLVESPQEINRENQLRIGRVNGNIHDRDLGSVMGDIQEELEDFDLPPGYFIEYGGIYNEMMDAFEELYLALFLAVVLVYMVMAAQFESLLYPFIIMFTLPLTIIGIIFSLLLTGRTLSVVAFIGIIMLAGIVVNNGIVMVDYINLLYHEKGYNRKDAIVEAGKTRLRPILMTTLTTILGMFPMALGIGEGSEVRAPMATVIIGGLITSTLLTLYLVPVIYSLLDELKLFVIKKLNQKEKKAIEG